MDTRVLWNLSRRVLWRKAVVVAVTAAVAACGGLTRNNRQPAEPTAQAGPGAQTTDAAQSAAPATRQPATATAQPAPAQSGDAAQLPPTPACDDGDDPTPPQTAGPFYTPDTPLRTSLLEPGLAGTQLLLTGHVLTTQCAPVAGALLDFWHTDNAGNYDNEGYTFRGHQFADDEGRFTLETIVPGIYPGRTRHIHVRVQAPGQPILTTQLYFPGESGNQGDGIFNSALLVALQDATGGKEAQFTFVLDLP